MSENKKLDKLVTGKKIVKNVIVIDDEDDESIEQSNDLQWRYIKHYDNKYKIYENGDIFMDNKKIEHYQDKKLDCPFVSLEYKGKTNRYIVSKIIYETFVGKINGGSKLIYKDGNKNNIHLRNLEVTNMHTRLCISDPLKLDDAKEWKPIRGFEELYKISDYGDIYSFRMNKIMKSTLTPSGYYRNALYYTDGIKHKVYMIHKLVYMTFKECDVDDIIDHIDGNKTNNYINNLRNQSINEITDNCDGEMNDIEWKYIVNYDKYRIFKNGDIFINNTKIEHFNHKTLNIPYVSFTKNGQSCSYSIARLVYETFVGKIKDGTKLKYKDNNTNNVNLNNLEIVNKHAKINNGKMIELDNTKEWKLLRGYEELYKISEYGDVYSIRLNKIMSLSLSEKGYYSLYLNKDKIKIKKLIHQLVFTTFKNCDVIDNNVIDHIDRSKINNHISNLREVTRSENAKNIDIKIKTEFDKVMQYDLDGIFIKEWDSTNEIIKNNPKWGKDHINHCCVGRKKTAYGFIWKYKDFIYDQTGYVSIKTDDNRKYDNYKINKNGKIINNRGRIIKTRINEYESIHLISNCGKEKNFYVHRLIALTFIQNPNNYNVVNHIDENKLNNCIDNLEWTTPSGNSKHSLAKKVQQIDISTGKIINTFDSIMEAYENIKTTNSKINSDNAWGIGQVCSGKYKTAYGYKWEFVK